MKRTAVGGNGQRGSGATTRERRDGPNRVSFYTRISTDEDHQKYSLGAQAERLEAYCKAQWGDDWRLHKLYRDTESGTHMNRPGLEEMLFDAEAQAFDTLLVFRVDRLSRKVRELALMVDELTKHGVVLKSITEPFDTANAAGKMMLQMLGVFAEFEHATIVERTKVGMEKKAKGGRFVGGNVPFGYRLDPEKGLVVYEEEALLVRKLFRMYAIGKIGSSAICKEFNETGLRNRNGRKWGRRVALYMLKNPVYIGKIRWREILYDGTHDPLVSEELFRNAQEVLDERNEDLKGRQFRHGEDRLLTGVIKCGKCGSHMFGGGGSKNGVAVLYYVCSKRFNYQACDQDYVRTDLLDGAIIHDIKAMFRDEQFMARVWEEANKRLAAERPNIEKEIEGNLAEAAKVQAATDRYFKAFEAGKLSPDLCNEKVQDLRARLEELEAQRQDLEARRERLELPAIDRQMLSSLVDEFEKVMAAGTSAQKKDLLHRVVKKVLIKDRHTVEVWYALPNRGAIESWNNWLPILTTDCTGSGAPWWQTFSVYQGHQDRRVVFRWEPPPAELPETVRTSPLHEARRYASILRNDPVVKTQADLAREMGVSRARVTQLLNLLRLAPEVQERLLGLEDPKAVRFFSERRLRPLIPIEDPRRQLREFQKMLAKVPG